MRESEFIKQNKKRWNDFENELKNNKFNPRRVSDHYIKIVDDLSFSRTHYPNRLVRSYLNGVSQILTLRIYKTQKGLWDGIKQFWSRDLPLVMYNARIELLLSFLIFALSVAVGAFSNWSDPDFVRFILGDGYVNMTIENIEKGDPMGVYKDEEMGSMFFRITLNNILVSAYVFSLGLVFGIGTIGALVYNGVMLGSFQQFFFARDLGAESMLTVWQHGTVEISCIIIAGAAGLSLSKGMLFPGTYSRLDAFRISGRKGLMMMLGLMPLLVYSGFIEAVITRLTDAHWIIRLSAILGSLAFVIIYFVWYPSRIAKNKAIEKEFKVNLQPIEQSSFRRKGIMTNPVIAGEAIIQLQKHRKIIAWIACMVLGLISTWIILDESIFKLGTDFHYRSYITTSDFAIIGRHFKVFIINVSLAFSSLIATALILLKMVGKSASRKQLFRFFWFILLSSIIIGLLSTNGWLSLILFVWIPITGLVLQSMIDTEHSLGFGHVLHMYRQGWRPITFLAFSLMSLGIFVLFATENFVLEILEQGIYRFIPNEDFSNQTLLVFLSSQLVLWLYFILLTLIFLSMSLSYYSLYELATAGNLIKRIHSDFKVEAHESKATGILQPSKLRAK